MSDPYHFGSNPPCIPSFPGHISSTGFAADLLYSFIKWNKINRELIIILEVFSIILANSAFKMKQLTQAKKPFVHSFVTTPF